MKYHLYVSYRSRVSGRWLKYRFVGLFDSFIAAVKGSVLASLLTMELTFSNE
jgi:hypothetical protein